jgi:hypothetical protein
LLVNALLAIAATLLTYLAAEAAFSLAGLRYVPLRLQADLPADVRVFAQSSKAGVVPREPVVLLGDSYAQGYGDWLLAADPDRNGPFHSAHVIQAITGRDVITLGQSGAGSAEGLVALPAAAYARTRDAWYLRLPPPGIAVVYFFEGNDLNNNTAFLARRVGAPTAPDLAERIDRTLAAYPAQFMGAPQTWRHLTLFRFASTMVRRLYAEGTAGSTPEPPAPYAGTGDPPNLVEVAGHAVALPANLQSPALELTGPEIDRAVLVFARALAFLRGLMPGVPVLVAYLPSPLASYRLAAPEVSIQPYMTDRPTRYPGERVAAASDMICGLIRAAAIAHGAGFLDLRPAIRATSAREVVHGPRDFKHYNRPGMEALGRAVAARIGEPTAQPPCWRSADADAATPPPPRE